MAAVKQKKRGQVNRSRTKLILIAAEGRNKTEKLYFHELFQNNKDYRVRFTSSTETDPVGIVASAVQYIQSEELDLKNGDLAFCAVDTDTDISKQGQINQARKLAEKTVLNFYFLILASRFGFFSTSGIARKAMHQMMKL